MHRLRAHWPLLVVGVFGGWLVGQLFRDICLPTALCFYFPSPLFVLVLLVAASGAYATRRRRWALAFALLASLPLGAVLLVENRLAPPPASAQRPSTIRLVHWNVYWGQRGWDAVAAHLRALSPDIVILSEPPRAVAAPALAAALGPDYEARHLWWMALAARGEIVSITRCEVSRRLRLYAARVRLAQGEVQIAMVDLPAHPLWSRREPLSRVWARVAQTHPALVVGDMNTPRRAWPLATLPVGYHHAYELVGGGWSYTWPARLPLLAIDQCVVSDAIEPLRYDLESTPASDHRAQIFDFALR